MFLKVGFSRFSSLYFFNAFLLFLTSSYLDFKGQFAVECCVWD